LEQFADNHPEQTFKTALLALSDSNRWHRGPSTQISHMISSIAAAYHTEIGYRVLTVLVVSNEENRTLRRIWSSAPESYPLDAELAATDSAWHASIFGQHHYFHCPDKPALKKNISDHEVIFALGCGAALSIPVSLAGTLLGTINLLHEQHWFAQARIVGAQALSTLALAPMLMARYPVLVRQGA